MSEPTNLVLLEKINNLGGSVKMLREENIRDHTDIVGRQNKTNGRLKKHDLILAGVSGAMTMLGIIWTVFQFLVK